MFKHILLKFSILVYIKTRTVAGHLQIYGSLFLIVDYFD